MPIFPPKKHSGFSLIELVTVLLIITVLSTIAIRSTVDIGYSARYEQTRETAENIRKAIIGNPGSTINGQPDISGFVADMGRTPDLLRELLEEFTCSISEHTPSDCLAASGTISWSSIGSLTVGMGGLKYGWNGPYLRTAEQATDDDALGDGWGNVSSDDYGWSLTTATGVGNPFSIKSKGKDQSSGTAGCIQYDDDCEYTINGNEYSRITSSITIAINSDDTSTYTDNGSCSNTTYLTKQTCVDNGGSWTTLIVSTTPTQQLCMRVYYREDDTINPFTSTNPTIPSINRDGSLQSLTFEFDTAGTPASPPTTPKIFPNGINAIGIYEYIGGCTNTIYPSTHPLQQAIFTTYKSIDNLVW